LGTISKSEGIEKYKKQIETIKDLEVDGVMKHILDEEKRHKKRVQD